MRLLLTVHYRTPSLNVTKRQHWAQQYKEQRKAYLALLSALQGSALNPLIQTTSPEVLKSFSTACATLGSYLATSHGASGLKQTK